MRFSVLGPVSVRRDDGIDVPVRGAQLRRLLTALLAAAPEPVSVDALADLLWPEGAPSGNALQAQVSKLRKALGEAEIRSDARGYALPTEGHQIDAHDFERLVSEGRAALAAGRYEEASTALAEALYLAGGRPFDEVADADLGRAVSSRMSSLVVAARSGRHEADLALGRVDQVAAELDGLVQSEPLHERWWSLLMLARYRQGRQADALRAFQEARRLLAEELGVDPGPELRELEARILAHDPSLMQPIDSAVGRLGDATARSVAGITELPARLASFIGRGGELELIQQMLTYSRLVTLLGPGGMGKTSTAIEVARRFRDRLTVVFVELARLGDPDLVAAAVIASLGLPESDQASSNVSATPDIERITEAFAGVDVLLVLDNCEHLVEEAAKLTHTLLQNCPSLRVLATSREVLGVPGEAIRALPPLEEDEAVELFVARAGAVITDFELDVTVAAKVRAISAFLDRMPLAIELAAARMRSLSLDDLMIRLDDRFAVLAAGARTVEPRQQALRAVVDWSHDLLDDRERRVFRRLAAFANGATLDAAEVVCSDAGDLDAGDLEASEASETGGDGEIPIAPMEVAPIIERLIDKSLVSVDRSLRQQRYRMLQTLYDYAAERLVASGEVEAVRARHAAYFAELIAPAERGLFGCSQSEWLRRLDGERENLRLALDVAVARGDADLALRLTAPIGWYFYMVGQADLGAVALGDALTCPGPTDPRLRALALAHHGWLSANGPDLDHAGRSANSALAMLGSFDDPWTDAFVFNTSLMTMFFRGEIERCYALLPEANDAAARAGDSWSLAMSALVRGEIHRQLGEVDDAQREFDESIEGFTEVGDRFAVAIAITEGAELLEMHGEYDKAAELLQRGIELADRTGFSGHPLGMRARLANIEVLRGNLDDGRKLHAELLADSSFRSMPWLRAVSQMGLATIARREGDPALAQRYLDEVWATARTHAVPFMRSTALVARGYTADQMGDGDTALDMQLQAVRECYQVMGPRQIANALEGLAGARAVRGEHVAAARLLGAADTVRRASGGAMPPAERFDVDRTEARARSGLGDGPFDAAFSEGAAADLDSLIAAELAG